ncbi:plastin-3-like [Anneissia japonica]|uniref:plastin-3-like n=1 Tax=Anneissia japonica TaxID=1529436 RepID=UPI0014259489|nr:plastin-3-like [Anneissia japonica]
MAQDISTDDVAELKEQFDMFDIDHNNHISVEELGEALKEAGFDLAGYQVREMITKLDKDENGTIEFNEFLEIYKTLKDDQVSSKFKVAISKKSGIVSKGGTSDVEGITHSFSEEEKVAFVDYINSQLKNDEMLESYLPINEKDDDLFSKVQDGILFCKMINNSSPGTVDERAMNTKKLTVFKKHENQTLALNSALSLGISIVNIGAEDLIKGTGHLVLGLLWQIIRIGLFAKIDLKEIPGLIRLLQEGEDPSILKTLSPEQLLIRWVNYQLEQAGDPRRIKNFSGDIMDSEVYTTLLRQIAPKDLNLDPVPMGPNYEQRAEKMLQNADKMKCRAFITPKDVVKGNAKLNTAFVANLFNNYPALDPPDEEGEVYEETREEKTFRNWMNSLGVRPYVNYLYTDLKNGLVLFKLYDEVKPGIVNWDKVNGPAALAKQGSAMKALENCNYAVDLGKQLKFSLVGIGGSDIYDGNQVLTLAMVWQLMRAYTVSVLQKLAGPDNTITDNDIVSWVNSKLEEAGKTSKIRNFKDKVISDSSPVLDLIDAIKPNSIDYSNFKKSASSDEDLLLNAQYAISMARKIGARVYALPEDIMEVNPKMVMTVFACLMVVEKQKK